METTLRHILLEEYDDIPALRMIRLSRAEIRTRAEALGVRIGSAVEVEDGDSIIGGGSTPDLALPTALLVVVKPVARGAAAEERRLRTLNPPIIARIEKDHVVIDLRTVFPEEDDKILPAFTRSTVKGVEL